VEGSTNCPDIIDLVARSAEPYPAAAGGVCFVIGTKSIASIASSRQVPRREVEIAALKERIVPRRYLRNIGTVGLGGQIKMLESSVAVVGAGGLGGAIVDLLARYGTGHLIIIDGDRFTEQDLNRQAICTEDNLGHYKAVAAAKRVRRINSTVAVTVFRKRLTRDNAQSLLNGARVAVDGLDNLQSRLAVEQACRQLAIPYVYGAIAGLNGQLMTIFPEDEGLSVVYGTACQTMPERGLETETGTPSVTPAMMAALQVQEVVKIITGAGEPSRHRILMVDVMASIIDRIETSR
jgi:molybdopterin-synthase adenylyltransferase